MSTRPEPTPTLSIADACFVIVGIVIGAGIFRAPSLVAANSASDAAMLLMWVAGGTIALIGALCYAELTSTYPSAGGEYHFLHRAFGRAPAFLFGWARLTVMQTGSIALLAYVFGDYATELLSLGPYSAAIYAALAVLAFTAINLAGIREGAGAQRLLTSVEVAGVLAIGAFGIALGQGLLGAPAAASPAGEAAAPASGALGLAMVFVLLTYGGWNEAAYVSAEMRGGRVALARALFISIAVITALYLLINLAYLLALGREGMAASDALAADLMRRAAGAPGAAFVSLLVAFCALTSINATIITGARSNYALGRDFRLFESLGRWDARANTPARSLLVQGAIALLLVLVASQARSGFASLVEYTAPVFWLFFLLTGLALFRLRRLEPGRERPFSVPAYPIVPLLFCASSAYMLWSSLNYAGRGALAGVAVLLVGIPVFILAQKRDSQARRGDEDVQVHADGARAGRERAVVDRPSPRTSG